MTYLVSTYLSYRLLQFILFFVLLLVTKIYYFVIFLSHFISYYIYILLLLFITFLIWLINITHNRQLKIHDSRTFYHVYLQLSKARRGITNRFLALSTFFLANLFCGITTAVPASCKYATFQRHLRQQESRPPAISS